MDKDIRTFTLQQLEELSQELGQPKFRGKQLYEWLQGRHATSYEEMTNLPKDLRSLLAERHPLLSSRILDRQVSKDGTRKYVVELADGSLIETVGMPSGSSDERLTVCFSTQVGCAMACAFCATGRERFKRNLTAAEMTDQIAIVEKEFSQRVTNAVAMGQGEPFLNYDAVLQALRMMNSSDSFNIGARHITVSTCGIVDGVDSFSREPEQFTLAISLHSAIQAKRDTLMPRVANQKLIDLKEALLRYVTRTNRRVTLEYLLLKDINDREEDLKALLEFCEGLLCHVNLLPMNAVTGSPYQPSPRATVDHWIHALEGKHIEATLRRSRGSDIDGACGQLKNAFRITQS